MGLADSIRIMLGKLTPAEVEEREAAARARHEQKMAVIQEETARLTAQNEATAANAAARRRETDLYQQRLSRAAGVATLELHCHQDTWTWITQWMNVERHRYSTWWPTSYDDRITKQADHMLVVRLSGTQTAEVLTRLARTGQVPGAVTSYDRTDATEQAIGRRLYDAIGRILDQITPDVASKQPVPPVVLDDRPDQDKL